MPVVSKRADALALKQAPVLSSKDILRLLVKGSAKSGVNEAIIQAGKRIRDISSMRGIIDRGVHDMHKVASSAATTSRDVARPLSSQADVWTFPICLITYSTLVLAWACELAGSPSPDWVAPSVGFVIGAAFAAAHRAASVRVWKQPKAPLNVVITGGTKGIGRALVREFLAAGDNVFIASRNSRNVRATLGELHGVCDRPRQIAGVECDVSRPASVARLASMAQAHFADGTIDVWINNAGVSGSFKSFLDADEADLQLVTQTNLLGALLCTRAAINAMSSPSQQRRGHVLNMDGAGANGAATPNYAAYGATKAGIAHLMESIAAECEEGGIDVGVHTLSPGMVLTELLLDGATLQNKQVFNVLCEHPEVVAAYLVSRVRSVAARNDKMAYIRFLTNLSAMARFAMAPLRLGRFFTRDGRVKYLDEDERLLGRGFKRTARAMSSSRRRGMPLQVSYAACLCLAVMMLSMPADDLSAVFSRFVLF